MIGSFSTYWQNHSLLLSVICLFADLLSLNRASTTSFISWFIEQSKVLPFILKFCWKMSLTIPFTKWVALIYLCISLLSRSRAFEVIKAQENSIYVFENDPLEIDCQSSDPFYKCRWTRPDATICAIFKDNEAKKCQNTLRSKHRIFRENVFLHILNMPHFRSRWVRH